MDTYQHLHVKKWHQAEKKDYPERLARTMLDIHIGPGVVLISPARRENLMIHEHWVAPTDDFCLSIGKNCPRMSTALVPSNEY